ncbi:MAG: helix-turn-helix transcriptional regulator [Methylohalobius sp. ZOD2]
MVISPGERAFFVELGARVAELRKTQGITQIQMADALGVSQQTVNTYEMGRWRFRCRRCRFWPRCSPRPSTNCY